MRKFLLVVFIGMALGMSIFGVIEDYKNSQIEEIDHIEETTTAVYME
jgi:hypothetical protein